MIDEFTLVRSIDEGFTSTVYEAQLEGRTFALKKYRTGREEFARQQFEMASSLHHPNILRYLHLREQANHRAHNQLDQRCCIIVLEYAQCGQLYGLINSQNGLAEEVARTYFHMLIDAVEHMHSLGIYHLDIKPQNILLDDTLQIKLGDFGFSTRNKVSQSLIGTIGYAAPEITWKTGFDCELADVYACGVVLFISVFGRLPFESSDLKNPARQLFRYDQEQFWRMFPQKTISSELKELLVWMLAENYMSRPRLEQLKYHPWFLQDVLMMDELADQLRHPRAKLM